MLISYHIYTYPSLLIRVSSFLSPSWILMEIPFAFVDEFFLAFDYCIDSLFIKKVEVILTIISSIAIQCIYIISIDTLLNLSHQHFKHLPIFSHQQAIVNLPTFTYSPFMSDPLSSTCNFHTRFSISKSISSPFNLSQMEMVE